MIIWQSEGTYKSYFSDRAEVVKTAKDLLRRGVVVCALCNGSLKYHGCYIRHTLDEERVRRQGWVAQAHCRACRKYPSLIPDFIMPYKHYDAEVIEYVIAASEKGLNVEQLDGCAADVSSMRRWLKQFCVRGELAIGWLISILANLYERYISTLKLLHKSLLGQLNQLLFEFSVPMTGSVIGNVNYILTTHNRGFL